MVLVSRQKRVKLATIYLALCGCATLLFLQEVQKELKAHVFVYSVRYFLLMSGVDVKLLSGVWPTVWLQSRVDSSQLLKTDTEADFQL